MVRGGLLCVEGVKIGGQFLCREAFVTQIGQARKLF